MNRFVHFAVIILYLIPATSLLSQNDSLGMVKFAQFLEKSKLYEFAAQEYERIYFTYPNEGHFDKILINYRLAGQLHQVEKRFFTNETSIGFLQYQLSLIDHSLYSRGQQALRQFNHLLAPDIYHHLRADYALFDGKSSNAKDIIVKNGISDPQYLRLIDEGSSIKSKSPFLAGLFSAILPGSGRFYTNDWANGIISVLFVGMTSYQAYSRFNKKGIKSTSGWIFGGVSLGFYLGNIYGSIQSAKAYNLKHRQKFNEKVKSHLDLYYSQY